MGFPTCVANQALVLCARHCCICDSFAGLSIELHHIKQTADGGDDSIDNCIPLCCNCHAQVNAYNPRHPGGRKYTETELRGHRDRCYKKYSGFLAQTATFSGLTGKSLFLASHTEMQIVGKHAKQEEICLPTPEMLVMVGADAIWDKSAPVYRLAGSGLGLKNRDIRRPIKETPKSAMLSFIAEGSLAGNDRLRRLSLIETIGQVIHLRKKTRPETR